MVKDRFIKFCSVILLILIGFSLSKLIEVSKNLEIPSGDSNERYSPKDWIKESDIQLYNDRVIIKVDNPYIARFADTNSMDPVFDVEANTIEIKPKSYKELQVGDIISYKSKISDDIIIHRIIKIGYDEYGWYAITKGDNNKIIDPEKVRFEQIKGVVIAIIY